MPTVEILEARPHHCGAMVRRLRMEHAVAFAKVGLNPHRELRATFMASAYRRAAFLDGRLAALWGVRGSILSASGFVWLCLTNEASRHPVMVLREARRQLDGIMRTKTEVYTTVLHADDAALRLCSWLGFHTGHEGLGAPASDRDGRRSQMQYIRNSPEIRMPVGHSYAMALGYHPEPDFDRRLPFAS